MKLFGDRRPLLLAVCGIGFIAVSTLHGSSGGPLWLVIMFAALGGGAIVQANENWKNTQSEGA